MLTYRRLWTVSTLLLVSAMLVKAVPSPPDCFGVTTNPDGWDLPITGQGQDEKPYQKEGYPKNTTIIRYGAAGPIWLPNYYVKDRNLILRQIKCRFESLSKLQAAGKPFAIFGFAKGLDIGIAGDVWWIDRDGDGRFEEFQWVTDHEPTVPEWVLHSPSAK